MSTAWCLYPGALRHHHCSAGASLRYVPRRAVLYCPGNDERKLKKLASLDVDCAVLDCEDGVALNKKVPKNTDARVLTKYWVIIIGRQKTHHSIDSCVTLNEYNSSSLRQTGARS